MSEELPHLKDFKVRDAGSYDDVADGFDRLVQTYSGPVLRRLLDRATPSGASRVLDIGCGTGIATFAVADRLDEGGHVLGIDLSDGMLGVATARAARENRAVGIEFRKMDAEKLELEDDSLDLVVSLFALKHFPRPVRALREACRVVRPGGRVVVGIGGGPPLLSMVGFRRRLRSLGDLLQKTRGRCLIACQFLEEIVDTHIPGTAEAETPGNWTGPEWRLGAIRTMFRDAGLTDIQSEWVGTRSVIATEEEFYELQATFSTVARKRLERAEPSQIEQIREEFRGIALRVLEKGGCLVYPVGLSIVEGRCGGGSD